MDKSRSDEGVVPVESVQIPAALADVEREHERADLVALLDPHEAIVEVAPVDPEEAARERERVRHRERSARKRAVGPRSSLRYSKRELEIEKAMNADLEHIQRPKTRGECAGIERPCPFVSCRYHLYLEASKSGAIRFNFPDIEVDQMTESCVLDVADRQGEQVEKIAELMNLTRERIRQLEVAAFEKMKTMGIVGEIRALVDEGPVGKRRLHVVQPDPDAAFDEEDLALERLAEERAERERVRAASLSAEGEEEDREERELEADADRLDEAEQTRGEPSAVSDDLSEPSGVRLIEGRELESELDLAVNDG